MFVLRLSSALGGKVVIKHPLLCTELSTRLCARGDKRNGKHSLTCACWDGRELRLLLTQNWSYPPWPHSDFVARVSSWVYVQIIAIVVTRGAWSPPPSCLESDSWQAWSGEREVLACGLAVKGTKFMAYLGAKHCALGIFWETRWTRNQGSCPVLRRPPKASWQSPKEMGFDIKREFTLTPGLAVYKQCHFFCASVSSPMKWRQW